MRANRAGSGLTIAAVASLILVTLLAVGFVTEMRPYLDRINGSVLHHYSLGLSRGRVVFVDWTSSPLPGTSSWSVYWNFRPARPDIRRSFWEFDAHRILSSGGRTWGFYIFAFPIWCAMPPCMIAPLMWWRKRRKPEPRGFAVTI